MIHLNECFFKSVFLFFLSVLAWLYLMGCLKKTREFQIIRYCLIGINIISRNPRSQKRLRQSSDLILQPQPPLLSSLPENCAREQRKHECRVKIQMLAHVPALNVVLLVNLKLAPFLGIE